LVIKKLYYDAARSTNHQGPMFIRSHSFYMLTGVQSCKPFEWGQWTGTYIKVSPRSRRCSDASSAAVSTAV